MKERYSRFGTRGTKDEGPFEKKSEFWTWNIKDLSHLSIGGPAGGVAATSCRITMRWIYKIRYLSKRSASLLKAKFEIHNPFTEVTENLFLVVYASLCNFGRSALGETRVLRECSGS
jgi:hypothetical protein